LKNGGKVCSDKLLIKPLKFFEKCQVAPPSVGVQPPGTQHLEKPRMAWVCCCGLDILGNPKKQKWPSPWSQLENDLQMDVLHRFLFPGSFVDPVI
jgi:hypothetical protein